MFRRVPLSIIRSFSLYTQQYIQIFLTACEQDQDGFPSWSRSQAVSKLVWHIPLLRVQWKTPDDGQRNCPKHVEFYSKNKFEKLLHLVRFIIRIYDDTQSPERQKANITYVQPLHVPPCIWSRYNRVIIFNSSVRTTDVRTFTAEKFPTPWTFVQNRIKNSFQRRTSVRGRIQFCTHGDNWQTWNGTLIKDFSEKYFIRYFFPKLLHLYWLENY